MSAARLTIMFVNSFFSVINLLPLISIQLIAAGHVYIYIWSGYYDIIL